jgi:hypothetical protein
MNIDYSQLNTFINCPKKYCNRYIKCLKKAEYDITSMDMEFGSAIHKGLEIFYTTKDMKQGVQAFLEVCPEDLEDQKVKTKEHGCMLLAQYEDYHANNFTDWEILDTEKTQEVKMNDQLTWIVKNDLIVKWRGNIYVVDFKTSTSKNRGQFFKYFEPNMQVTGYTWACKKLYGQCSGFIPMALFMGHRSRMYKGEPAGFYANYEHTIINRTPDQLNDFEFNVMQWVERLNKCKEKNIFPKNENACHNYRGCGFKELCLSCDDPSIEELMYEEYDPFEYLKQEDNNDNA